MKARAEITIVGGGIAGASAAYHLAMLGKRDVLVLEQAELVSGTTSHAPGLVGQLRSSESLTRMLVDSVALYRTLAVDGVCGYQPTGSLRLASSPARLNEIKRQCDFANRLGLEAALLDPTETAERYPLIDRAGVEGALWLPTDGSADAVVLAQALIAAARGSGVTFQEHARVEGMEINNGAIAAVQTRQGRVETETLVLACGIWSPRVGKLAGIDVALQPMQHQYGVTDSLAELSGRTTPLPNLRDPDNLVYMRQRGESLVLGGYERNPRTFASVDIPDADNPTVRPFDRAHFRQLHDAAARRVPALRGAEYEREVNGLESFTPDGEFLLGPVEAVRGLWLACGFCAHGVSGSGGVGKTLAAWLVHGESPYEIGEMAPDRFGPRAADADWIAREVCRIYGTYYDLPAA